MGDSQTEPRIRTLWLVARKAVGQFVTDGTLTSGAALSFYLALSLAPLLLLALWFLDLVWSQPEAGRQIVTQAQRFFGTKGAQTIRSLLEQASEAGAGPLSLAAGLIVGLLGATGAFLHLQKGLDAIWNVKPGSRSWAEMAWDRLTSAAVVVVIGLLLLSSLLLTAVLAALNLRLQAHVPAIAWLWQGLEFIGSLGVTTLLFACVYKFLPHIMISWRQVWLGAFVTALLFNLGKSFTGWYLGCSALGTTAQSLGAVIIVLLWEYYSSLVILFGAEFIHAYVRVSAAQVAPGQDAMAAPTA